MSEVKLTAAEKIKALAEAKANGTELEPIEVPTSTNNINPFQLDKSKATVKFRVKSCKYFPSRDPEKMYNEDAGSYSFYAMNEPTEIAFTLPAGTFHHMLRQAGVLTAKLFIKGSIARVQYHAKDDVMYRGVIADKDFYYTSAVEFDFCQNMVSVATSLKAGISLPLVEDEDDEDLAQYVTKPSSN